jgi:putative membrane protein
VIGEGTDDPKPGEDPPSRSARVEVRQQLAADRTLLAFVRTAIALAGLGFVVAKFNLALQAGKQTTTTHQHVASALGVVLVAAAAVVLVLGLVQHRQVLDLLAAHGDPLDGPRWPAAVSGVVALLAIVAVGVYLAAGVH